MLIKYIFLDSTNSFSQNAVAGPSNAGPSNSSIALKDPWTIDLTASRSPTPPWAWVTPEPSLTVNPDYSDPVEYEYLTGPGPRIPYKFI